jgi:hypothetical protein
VTRRRALFATVLTALALALAGALLAPAPRDLPAVALGAALVWRVEVAAILFAAAYGAVVTARLALHGHTYTRVGSAGIEIPQVARVEAEEKTDRGTAAEIAINGIQRSVEELIERVDALEHPTDLLLNPDRKAP